MKKWYFIALGLFLSVPLTAKSEVSISMELYNTFYQGIDDWYYNGYGKIKLDFQSTANRYTKAEFETDFYPVDVGSASPSDTNRFYVKRAALKTRLFGSLFTVGKTRLSWGPSNAVVFNSGDVIFGSRNPFVDFTQENIRSNTTWLSAAQLPIGLLSFVEAVILPPTNSLDSTGNVPIGLTPAEAVPTIKQASGGVRGKFSIGNFWLEPGIYYKGQEQTLNDDLGLRPYLSFAGNLGVDFYSAISTALDYTDTKFKEDEDYRIESIKKTTNMSLGLLQRLTLQNATMTLRLEALVQPWANWEAQDISTLQATDEGYGLLLYPEITYLYGNNYVYTLQAIISPIDASAQWTATVGWYISQGLYWVNFLSLNSGDKNDLFAWDRTNSSLDVPIYTGNGKSFTSGLRFVY